MVNGNLKNVSIFQLIKKSAVLLIHKFSTEHNGTSKPAFCKGLI